MTSIRMGVWGKSSNLSRVFGFFCFKIKGLLFIFMDCYSFLWMKRVRCHKIDGFFVDVINV